MMRVRIDGGQLSSDAAAGDRRDQHRVRPGRRRRHRPAERAVPLDPHRGRARRSGGGWRRSACRRRRPAATPRAACSTARSPASSRTRSSTPATCMAETVAQVRRQPGVQQPAAQVEDVDVAAASTTAPSPRSTTSPSSACVNADGEAGYDLWVGGGLSTNPMFAQRIGVFVRPDQVTDVWAAATVDLPRLRLPPAAQPRADQVPDGRLGPGEVPPGAAGRVPARRRCPTARPPRRPKHDQRDHVGVASRRTAPTPSASRCAPAGSAAACSPGSPTSPTSTAQGRIRTTTQQKLVILDVPDERVEDLVAALAEHDLLVRPSAFRRGTMACTGLEFCKLAIVETKQHAQDLYAELEKRLPGLRRADRHQRQRLPEQLRPVPDRRHRLQGLDGPRRQRRDGRGLPGAPGRPPRRRGRPSAASSAATR